MWNSVFLDILKTFLCISCNTPLFQKHLESDFIKRESDMIRFNFCGKCCMSNIKHAHLVRDGHHFGPFSYTRTSAFQRPYKMECSVYLKIISFTFCNTFTMKPDIKKKTKSSWLNFSRNLFIKLLWLKLFHNKSKFKIWF